MTIRRARDLVSKTSTSRCDPVATVSLDAQEFSTEKIKGARCPEFDKTFAFERAKLGPSLTVSVRDASGGVKGGFLGQAVVTLEGLERDIPRQDWHQLRPLQADIEKYSEGRGSARFSVSLSHNMVLPLQSYNGLVGLLQDSIKEESSIEHGACSPLCASAVPTSRWRTRCTQQMTVGVYSFRVPALAYPRLLLCSCAAAQLCGSLYCCCTLAGLGAMAALLCGCAELPGCRSTVSTVASAHPLHHSGIVFLTQTAWPYDFFGRHARIQA